MTRRYKERAELDVEESLAVIRAQRAGEPVPKFETPEYRQARRQALEDAGLEPEDDDSDDERSLDDLSPEEHFQRMRGRR
jgi:hypothetical protein